MLEFPRKFLKSLQRTKFHFTDFFDQFGDLDAFIRHKLDGERRTIYQPSKNLFGRFPETIALLQFLLRNRVFSLVSRYFWWWENRMDSMEHSAREMPKVIGIGIIGSGNEVIDEHLGDVDERGCCGEPIQSRLGGRVKHLVFELVRW